jgi:general secretion pathway protein J
VPNGFTLFEVLVAITLFGLLIGILVGGFRFGARVWEQADLAEAQVGEVETAHSIVRRLLTSALPVSLANVDGDVAVDFQGGPDNVSFVGPAPVQAFTGGLHAITLGVVEGRAGLRLLLNVRRYVSPDALRAGRQPPIGREADGETVVLLDGARAIQFAYFGQGLETTDMSWQPLWTRRPAMPRLIALRIAFPPGDRRVWPDLLSAPAVRVGAF